MSTLFTQSAEEVDDIKILSSKSSTLNVESTVYRNDSNSSNGMDDVISNLKYLQESFNDLNGKYNKLLWEIKQIHEFKSEVSSLSKKLEVMRNYQQFPYVNTSIYETDNNMAKEFSNSLAISLSGWKQANKPFIGQLECVKEGSKDIKNILTTLNLRLIWYGFMIILFIVGLTVTLVILNSSADKQGWDSDISKNTSLRLFSREEWQAQPSRGIVKQLQQNPPHYVIICHTAGRNCTSFPECSRAVRDIQFDHMGRGWDDMGMHFLVGGDGAAYTGLGWGKHGSHTLPFNSKSIAIYFIGNFMFYVPPKRQIRAAKLLIEEGVKLGKIAPDYKLFAHKQIWATESPGAALIQDIKKWPHWSSYENEMLSD